MLSFSLFIRSRKYLVSALFYLALSLVFTTWITYIPYVCEKLHLTEGVFGGALFFMAAGSFAMISFAPRLIGRYGVGKMVLYGLIYFCITALLPIVAINYVTLCFGLFMMGTGSCLFNVSMNALTGTIEKSDGVMIMSGSHGFFSAGGIIGIGIGSFLASKLGNPLLHYIIVITVLISTQLYFKRYYWHIRGAVAEHKKTKFSSFKPLFMVALIALIVKVAEGAIADWSSLYLKNVVHMNEVYWGFGYGSFAIAMTIGRFFGDWISHRFGSWQIIGGGTLLSVFGVAFVLTTYPALVLVGFSVVGLGLSVIVPEVFRIATRVKNLETSAGISFISGISNLGFLVGPVLLGLMAELHSLRFSYLALAGFVSIAVVISAVKILNARRA